MRYTLTAVWVLAVACGGAPKNTASDSAAAVAGLRDSLITMGTTDQADRNDFGVAAGRNDTTYMMRMMRGDSARTRWLQAFVASRGWPRRSTYGDSAVKAAWLIVQHSPDYAFQEQTLPLLEDAARDGEVSRADVAMLADRVAVHHGERQRYGTQFSLHDGQFVADPIADLKALDSLRSTAGLPPMKEYVEMMAKVYKMPVQWPPRP